MLQELSLEKIVLLTGGKILSGEKSFEITQISIDSRQLITPEKTLFVALKGAKANGEDFIPELIAQGVLAFLVHEGYVLDINQNCLPSFVEVKDTRKALQVLAKYQRAAFSKPVISITGSNGKTIVKEWLGQVLSQDYAVAKSPKSYNSQVGVPLSIFGIEPYHQVAILEAGISKVGEMEVLEEMIRPDLVIFTNIGTAHEDGFENFTQKIEQKLNLFRNSSLLIYCHDQIKLRQEIVSRFSSEKLIGWSDEIGVEFVRSLKPTEKGMRLMLMKKDLSTFTFQIPFGDSASIQNITHVIVAALTLGQSTERIQAGIHHLKPVDMRLTLKPGINDSLLIDDTYNNDLAGLKVAFDFMQQQRPKKRKILIISDLLQQGFPEHVYGEVADLITHHGLDLIIGVGTEIGRLQVTFPNSFQGYLSTEEVLLGLDWTSFSQDLVLITGARSFGFEQIVNKLQQRIHGTTLEINLNALSHNFNFYKRKIVHNTKVMVMVKAFAYGGGAVEIAHHLQTMGADYLAVAFTDEGVTLRRQGIRLPIMVLNPVEESFDLCREYTLEPVVFSLAFFQSLALYCLHQEIEMSIHLDLDTGMKRLGFERQDLEDLKQMISTYPQLYIASIYTHLVGADEEEHQEFSLGQLALFNEMKAEILSRLPYQPLVHALNSAGILAFPAFQFDMVRLGIGLYGVEVTGKYDAALRPISTLKTTISQVKTILSNETIGYSRKGKLETDGKIATLSIGYADGYDRRFSNGKGYVLIQGKKALVVGNVCMDMVMVDVTDLDVKAGDEAIIYGDQIPLKDLADRIGTIPYELLTNISTRVKRVYYLD